MDTLLQDQILKNKTKMIQNLLKGKESIAQVRILLQQPVEHGGLDSAEELSVKALRSFTETLSMLEPSDTGDLSPKISDEHRIKQVGPRERRGCYRRRNATESRVEFSATMEDGYAWRKYGQKEILSLEYPRCYFRCTHKYDQGCKATKQVQKLKQDSLVYQITYFGHHTCKDTPTTPQIISEIDPIDSCLLSFESKTQTKPDCHSSTALTIPAATSKATRSDASARNVTSPVLSSCTWQDVITSDSSGNTRMMTPEIRGHLEEVVSSYGSPESFENLDMVNFNELGDLGNELYFGEDEFLQVFR